MNWDRRNTGRPNGKLLAALVSSAFAIALSGAALAGPGMEDHPHDNKGKDGGCSACGSGGGNDAAIQDASRTAGEKSRNAGNEGGSGITSVSSGQRGGGPLGGAIAQLGATQKENEQNRPDPSIDLLFGLNGAVGMDEATEVDRKAGLSGPPATRRDLQAEAEAAARWTAFEKEKARLDEIHKHPADISKAWDAVLRKHFGWDDPPGPANEPGQTLPDVTPAPGTTPPDPAPATPSAALGSAPSRRPAEDDDLPGVSKRSPYNQH